MKSPRLRSITSAVLIAFATAACSTAAPGGVQPSDGPRPATMAEFEALYQARADSARMLYTDADVHFMTHMIDHHAQALEMSRLAPTNGASAEIRTLAARIINAQADEIVTMQRWLADRDQPVPAVEVGEMHGAARGAAHDMHAAGTIEMSGMLMPGMLTPDQMRALQAARGVEFDRLFLTLMIQHHGGAVAMVEELFATDGAGQNEQVFKFASDALADQGSEISRMEEMLEALGR